MADRCAIVRPRGWGKPQAFWCSMSEAFLLCLVLFAALYVAWAIRDVAAAVSGAAAQVTRATEQVARATERLTSVVESVRPPAPSPDVEPESVAPDWVIKKRQWDDERKRIAGLGDDGLAAYLAQKFGSDPQSQLIAEVLDFRRKVGLDAAVAAIVERDSHAVKVEK